MPKSPRSPVFWVSCFFLWFAILWFLSSRTGDETKLPLFPHADKFAHFGYYLGGGGLLSAFLFRLNPAKPRWAIRILLVVVIMGLVGCSDEVHQSYTPGRSGNDIYDWLADVSGAFCGALIFKRLHHLLK